MVRARVSTPDMPTMPRAVSHWSQMLAGPIAGGLRYRRVDNAAPDTGGGGEIRRLDVLGIGAGVADMREGKHHDLPGIGRIGEDFLISGNRGVEANLARGLSNRANAEALNNQAVGQNNRSCVRAIAPCGGAVAFISVMARPWAGAVCPPARPRF